MILPFGEIDEHPRGKKFSRFIHLTLLLTITL